MPAANLRKALGRPEGNRTLVGLEHEYSVSEAGKALDFRALIHHLPIDGRRLDPGDGDAYRCRWGGVITAEAQEAEVATPPVEVAAGFAHVLDGWGEVGKAHLLGALPDGIDATGYSTHLSVSLPNRRLRRVAPLYVGHFSPSLMLMMDRRDSPGVRFRLRPGRMELCGEYLTGESLRNGAVFALGSVRSAALRSYPPAVRFRAESLYDRPGWYVDRRAFGVDLYTEGREAELEGPGGRTISAGEHLERSWALVRPLLSDVAPGEIAAVDKAVRGDAPLPCEAPSEGPSGGTRPSGTVFAGILGARIRTGYVVRAILATWDFTVFEVVAADRVAYASIPSALLARFLSRLDDGSLDTLIVRYLERPRRATMLASHHQTGHPGLFDGLGSATELLAPESGIGSRGAVGAARSRRDKGRTPRPRPHVVVPPSRRPSWKVIAAGVAVLLLIAVVALARRSPGETEEVVRAAPTPSVGPTVSPAPVPEVATPRLGRMIATFELVTTTYEVEIEGVDLADLPLTWRNSNDCGDFEPDGAVVRWIHPHDERSGACPAESFHRGTITLTVSGDGFTCRVVYRQGSEEGRGPKPEPCL